MEQIHFKNLVCFLYCSSHLLLCIWKTLWSCLWFVVLCLMGENLFVNFSSGHCWNIHTLTTNLGTLACDPLTSTCSWDEVAAVCPPPALVLVFHCGCSHCLGHLLSPPVPVLYGLALEIVSFWVSQYPVFLTFSVHQDFVYRSPVLTLFCGLRVTPGRCRIWSEKRKCHVCWKVFTALINPYVTWGSS